ncbi:uncharacterized protein LOC133195701 [Saccostrea echinata]|uniref:uncharacterized protein LOC133195701 n=1 Tax=Saccostrea echinata TaxID=191078 RepID=UPI002A7EFF76|nr:uncharacterized protein LOC133195701 [Saccostrea echinata]
MPRHGLLVKLILALGVSFLTSECSEPDPPVYNSHEDPTVLVLVDIHRSTDDNGVCTDFSPRAAELTFTLEWLNQDLVKKGKNNSTSPGILVYDTCGDVRRTMLILGYVFVTDNTSISSVISYGNPSVRSNISHFLRPFGVPHIHINQTAHVSTQDILDIDIGTVSPWKIRDIIKIVIDLGWNNFAVISSNHPSAIASRDLFLRMASSYSLCITSSVTYENTKSFDPLPPHVILFVSADDSYDAITSNMAFFNSAVMVTSDHWEDLTSNFTDTFLYLEHLNTSSNLVQYVKDKIEDTSNNSTILNLYRERKSCNINASEGICNGQRIATFLPSRFVGRDVEATISAFINSQEILKHIYSNNCTNFDLSKCDASKEFKAVLADFSDDIMSFIGKYQMAKEHGGEMTSFIYRGYITVAEVRSKKIEIKNAEMWNQLKVPSEGACSGYSCVNCTRLTSPPTKDDIIVLEGDVNIRLEYPLTENSQSGQSCGDWRTEGVIMTEVFKYELSDVKRRYPKVLQNIRLGGVIFDTCQGKSKRNEHIYADINYVNDGELLSYDSLPSGNLFSVSSLGVSFGNPDSLQFVRASVDLLISLKWIYINVVFSGSEQNLLTEFENYLNLKGNDICLSNKILVSGNGNLTELAIKLQEVLRKSNGGAFILLTNTKDTFRLNVALSNIKNAFSGANFVTFPWNQNIIGNPGTIAILQSENSMDDVVPAIQYLSPDMYSTNPILKGFHENRYKCSLTVHPRMIYPDICPSVPTFTNETILISKMSAIRNAIEAVVLTLDRYYQDVCPLQTGKCASLVNQVDLSKYLSAQKDEEKGKSGSYNELVTNKDVFIYLGNSLNTSSSKIGYIEKDGNVSVSGNEVKAYNSDFIPYTAVHQCPDWCPECLGCQAASTKNTRKLFHSGDIVVAGLFPVHTSVSSFCDVLATDKRADMTIDAFLFAIESSKERYPYLLPGVSLGSLILDTCSNANMAVQKIMNFETCRESYNDSGMIAGPEMLTIYVSADSGNPTGRVQEMLEKYKKTSLALGDESPSTFDDVTSRFYSLHSKAGIRLIVEILNSTQWTYIDVVRSESPVFDSVVNDFLSTCRSFNICVQNVSPIHKYTGSSEPTLTVTVILAKMMEIKTFFKSLTSTPQEHSFIIGEILPSWNDTSDFVLPNNARIITIERVGKLNTDLMKVISDDSSISKRNPWKKEYEEAFSSCISPQCEHQADLLLASKIVFGIDVMLHAFHNRFEKLCPNYYGICPMFASEGIQLQSDHFHNISFRYLNDIQVDFPFKTPESWAFTVKNFKGVSLIDIGNYSDGVLHMNPLGIFDTNGRIPQGQESRCFSNCRCVGLEDKKNTTDKDSRADPYAKMELKFYKSTAELSKELWTIIVLIIGVGGAFAALCFVIYVFHKVCAGLLSKRYVGLGILLLISIIFLFLSVLPFVFSPSEIVCSTRFFIPGFAYTLSFATVMAKIMSLRSYKLIGLGGELSNINQFLTVLFITGVQVAVGVHFWYIEDNKMGFLRSRLDDANEKEYACVFDRTEFVKYLVFVMFLIVLCAIYSIFVRKETKNMGEAKFIMVYSWLCIPIWVAWVVTLLLLPRYWAEVIVCIGILTCATLMTLIVFLPKLHRISRLKYDVERSGTQNGGYKLDNDFMFERPYTLPTSSNSFKYSEKNNPKFISSFDTSLSY